jgi:hypothetical protein
VLVSEHLAWGACNEYLQLLIITRTRHRIACCSDKVLRHLFETNFRNRCRGCDMTVAMI